MCNSSCYTKKFFYSDRLNKALKCSSQFETNNRYLRAAINKQTSNLKLFTCPGKPASLHIPWYNDFFLLVSKELLIEFAVKPDGFTSVCFFCLLR